MPQGIRRFGGRNYYRLLKEIPHFDSRGRQRSPAQTTQAAEAWANHYRTRGYNARVVNWVGGSGLFIGRRAQRIYNKTQDEARKEWMDAIEQSDYDATAFGIGMSFSNNATAGDSIASSSDAVGLGDQSVIKLPDFEHSLSQSTLDDALAESETIPVHSANPGGMHPGDTGMGSYYGSTIMGKMIDEVGWHGQIGWGPGDVPEERIPKDVDLRRSRFRVVLVFEQPDGIGERPSFAFATMEGAQEFADKLKELIAKNGYYREGGKISPSPDVSYNTPVWIIPAEKISVDIVPEESGWVQERVDDARMIQNLNPEDLFPFGGRQKFNIGEPLISDPTAPAHSRLHVEHQARDAKRRHRSNRPPRDALHHRGTAPLAREFVLESGALRDMKASELEAAEFHVLKSQNRPRQGLLFEELEEAAQALVLRHAIDLSPIERYVDVEDLPLKRYNPDGSIFIEGET